MRVFKNTVFTRFAKKAGITDEALCKAIQNAEKGLVDADLGGGLIKQRVARQGAGKSGGFRTIILFKKGDRSFFVYGFAKNKIANISDTDLMALKKLAAHMLNCDSSYIESLIDEKLLIEVDYEKETIS